MRYGITGLASLVKLKYKLDPYDKGMLFLLCGCRTDRIKGLLWEGDGFLLISMVALDELDIIEYYQQPGKAHHLSEMTEKQRGLYEMMGVVAPT